MQQLYSRLCLHLIKSLWTFAFLLSLFSCNRVRHKSDHAVAETEKAFLQCKQKIDDKKNQLVEKAFPVYDNNKQDTENNKKRLKEHLQVDLTPDVKNIYANGVS